MPWMLTFFHWNNCTVSARAAGARQATRVSNRARQETLLIIRYLEMISPRSNAVGRGAAPRGNVNGGAGVGRDLRVVIQSSGREPPIAGDGAEHCAIAGTRGGDVPHRIRP